MTPAPQPAAPEKPVADEYGDAFEEFAKPPGANPEPVPEPEPEPEPAPEPEPTTTLTEAEPHAPEPTANEPPRRAKPELFEPIPVNDPLWQNATPEQRDAYSAVAQRFKSDRGRLPAIQRALAERERENELLRSQIRTAQPPKPAAPQPEPPDAEAMLSAEEWRKLNEEYPEVAGPMTKVLSAIAEDNKRLRAQLQNVGQSVDNIGTHVNQRASDEQYALLEDAIPDWQEIADSKEWAEWVQVQPAYLRQAIAQQGQRITDAATAVDIFNRFKLEMAANEPPQPSATPSPNGATAPPNPTAARRARQLAGSRTVSQKGPAPSLGEPDSFDDAWDYYARKATAGA